jgi:hypothetical protein
MKNISVFLGLALGAIPLLAPGAQAGSLPFGTGIFIQGTAGSIQTDNVVSYYAPSLPGSVTPYGLILPNGPAVATFSPGLDIPGYTADSGSVSIQHTGGSATAAADMPSGSLHVLAQSTYNPGWGAIASASMADFVTFHVLGASPAVIDVGVSLDGIVSGAGAGAGGYTGSLAFSFGGGFQFYGFIANNGDTAGGLAGSSGYSPPYGWNSYTDSVSPTGFVFNGQLSVTDGQRLFLDMFLSTTTGGGATADFLNTAQLSLGLPGGVTFTSDSGVLLTASVPELSTWVLMLLGFASLGYAGYRRNKAATLAA